MISTGRPDLAAVIMGSIPLACLRCCAAPVMSYKQPTTADASVKPQKQMFKFPIKQHAAVVMTSTKNTKMVGNPSKEKKKQKNKDRKKSTVYLHLFGAQCCTQKSLSP